MKNNYKRLTIFTIAVILIFVTLLGRLAYLQVINGDYYAEVADNMGSKEILELAPRGEILDRNGLKLATNIQSFNVIYQNTNTKIKNGEINNILLNTIRYIDKNNDGEKINTQSLPIKIDGGSISFSFNTSSDKIRKQLETNFKNKYKLDLSFDAKNTYMELADKFGLTAKNSNGSLSLKSGISQDEMFKLIALRLVIKDVGYSQYKTVYIAKNISRQTAFLIDNKSSDLPGIQCNVEPMRFYPNHAVGADFIGYLGKIDDTESDKYTNLGYDVSRELVGKLGLEKALENNKDLNISLRGEPGVKYVEVDKYGKIIKETATLDPIPGDTVETTIDLNLQKVAEQALQQTMEDIVTGKTHTDQPYRNATRGAAVVINVNTGEILALASQTLKQSESDPDYDPNLFAETGSIKDQTTRLKLFGDPNTKDPYDLLPKIMYNYATMGSGPVGSTFKPLTAIAALEEGVITASTKIEDKGQYDSLRACWLWTQSHATHGWIDVADALKVSCNYFFWTIGNKLGYDRFTKWTTAFGLSSGPDGQKPKTGIEIEETPGDVSTPFKYKSLNLKSEMNNIIKMLSTQKYGSYPINKGSIEYNTIEQMLNTGKFDANALEGIGISRSSTQGKKAQDYIKREVTHFNNQANSNGELLNASIGQGQTSLTPLQMAGYISTLVNGGTRYKLHLVKKVLNPDGSTKEEFNPQIISKLNLNPQDVEAVKLGMEKVTEDGGTAAAAFQNYTLPNGGKTGGKTGSASVGPSQTKAGRSAYGWYVGFAPLDKPQIAVAVVIYDSGHGGYVAPVARKIYDAYFAVDKQTSTSNNKSTTTQIKTKVND